MQFVSYALRQRLRHLIGANTIVGTVSQHSQECKKTQPALFVVPRDLDL